MDYASKFMNFVILIVGAPQTQKGGETLAKIAFTQWAINNMSYFCGKSVTCTCTTCRFGT